MEQNENMPLNEAEAEDTVILEAEDGTEIKMLVDRYFFYNGEEYVLLVDKDAEENDEEGIGCLIMKVVPAEDGEEDEEEFLQIEDEDLLERLLEVANTQFREDTDIEE